MKKIILKFAIVGVILTQVSIFANESSNMMENAKVEEDNLISNKVQLIPDDLCVNSSYMKTFDINKNNGGSVELNVINSGEYHVWIKIMINKKYVYSKILQKGEAVMYRGNAVDGHYEVKIDSPTGGRMQTTIGAVQY